MFTPLGFSGLLLGIPGYGGGGAAVLPSVATTGFWMEPTAGDVTALAVGTATGATTSGTIATVDGPTYHAGTVKALQFTQGAPGSRISFPNLTGKPFTDCNTSFWVAGLIKFTSSPSNEGLCGCGAGSDAQAGWRILVSANTVSFTLGNGTTRGSAGPISMANFPLNEWFSIIIEAVRTNTGTNEWTVRMTSRGYDRYNVSNAQRTFTLDMSAPIVPATAFTIGDTSTSKSLPFDGSCVVAVGEHPVDGEFLTDDETEALCNHNQFRLWGDYEAIPENQPIKYFFMGVPDTDELSISVRTEQSVTCKVLNTSRTEIASVSATPSNGFAKATFTGLTADTEYLLEFVQGGKRSIRQGRFATLPTDNTYAFAVTGCSKFEEGESKEIQTGLWNMIAHADEIKFCLWNGDLGYHDVAENNVSAKIARGDEIFAGRKTRYFLERMPIAWTADDHDAADNDCDSTSVAMPAARTYIRALNPFPAASFPDASAWYHSFVRNNMRFLLLDTRSEKTGSVMMSTTQLAWIEAELSAAAAAGEAVVIVTPNVWDMAPSTPVSSQIWQYYPTQRTAIFDAIASAYGTTNNSVITLAGDIHMAGIDSGVNQGDFDTGGLLSVPSMIAVRIDHPSSTATGTWSVGTDAGVGTWGTVVMTDNAGNIDYTLKANENATTNLTLSGTLTLPTP